MSVAPEASWGAIQWSRWLKISRSGSESKARVATTLAHEIVARADTPHTLLRVDADGPEGFLARITRAKQHRPGIAALAVGGNQRRQIRVEQHVAGDDQAGVALAQKIRDAPDAAPGIEQLCFDRKAQIDAQRAMAAGRVHQDVGKVMGIDDDFRHAMAREQRERVGDEGNAAHGEGGFRAEFGEWPKPGSQSGGDDHRPHSSSGIA